MHKRQVIACLDDDQFVRKAPEGSFSSAGYQASMIGSVGKFLQTLGTSQFSCLIKGMKSRSITGPQLLRQLFVEGHAFPTINISDFGDEQLREQSMAAGALGFLHKPMRDAERLSLLDVALGSPAR